MNIELKGSVKISRRLANHKWWNRDPFSAGQAWVDLLLLTNNRPMDVFMRGEPIHLDRGQLGWSIEGLALRWKRSREWASKFIKDLAEDGQVRIECCNQRKTIITVCNYDVYNPSLDPTTDPTLEPATELLNSLEVLDHDDPTTDPTTDPTLEPALDPTLDPTRNMNLNRKGKGSAEVPAPEISIPSDDEVEAYCTGYLGDQARGIPAGIPEVWWTGWLESRLRDPARFPKDWRRALMLSFRSDFAAHHSKLAVEGGEWAAQKKNGAAGGAGTNGKRARWQIEKDLESVGDQIERHPRSSWPVGKPMPEDVRLGYDELVKQRMRLEAELAGGAQ